MRSLRTGITQKVGGNRKQCEARMIYESVDTNKTAIQLDFPIFSALRQGVH